MRVVAIGGTGLLTRGGVVGSACTRNALDAIASKTSIAAATNAVLLGSGRAASRLISGPVADLALGANRPIAEKARVASTIVNSVFLIKSR